MHGILRVKGNGTFPSDINFDKLSQEADDYIVGVAAIGGGFFCMSIIFLLLCIVVLLKCCCKCRRFPFNRRSESKGYFIPFVVLFLLFAGSIILGGVFALHGDKSFASALDNTVVLMKDVSSSLGNIVKATNTYKSALGNIQTNLKSSQAEANKLGLSLGIDMSLFQTAGAYIDNIDKTLSPMNGYIGNFEDTVEVIQKYHKAVVMAFCSLVLVLVILFTITTVMAPAFSDRRSNSGIRTCLTKGIMMPVLIIFTVILTIIMALIGVLAVVGSDICINPDQIVLSFSKNIQMPKSLEKAGITSNILEDVVKCSTPTSAFDAFEKKYIQGANANISNTVNTIPGKIKLLEDNVKQGKILAVDAKKEIAVLTQLSNDLNAAKTDLNKGTDLFTNVTSCTNTNSLYRQSVHVILCKNTTNLMVMTWAGLFLISLGMMLLVLFFGPIAIASIEDLEEKDEDENKSEDDDNDDLEKGLGEEGKEGKEDEQGKEGEKGKENTMESNDFMLNIDETASSRDESNSEVPLN
eukprot:Pgem_evm1s1447